ncbi:ATP-binding cassette domain-containing protein [Cellulosimicrobium composti]|uniref:ATP-binding cassette domain-containing protein n=1 Tax=Cellulosimicrobium composti TaxID=2672572 RepID=A0A6N7ZEE5_9MICO|nr:ATP-binding cassette domain-containing protein [Cellulosimicrobium composti]MTG87672.1 ATP-binding cassette domain-containing protein [Cellulosimicrobium composti]NDO89811.1 sugar ABC transporter ATP-binding protein [Cellulosimicrobium composti]TWG86373.1 D-xylose transport system ATP-binding protein [Cellulosimicrobium cellulans J34]SME89009.1 monosaccharide ABC transporter ATP-binding protein, CUT2 family (TC 3.A.1.2.-) [Cellulosimicrobium cellulans J1]
MSAPVLSLRGVSKNFGGVRALVDVDVDVREHEVLAVVGDNGAGKSTLAGVIAGAFRPDGGEVLLDGAPVVLDSPAAARTHGIAAVFQQLALVDDLDVVENVFLGQETLRGPFLDEIAMEREAWGLLDQLAATVPSVRQPVRTLSGGQRQVVAVARALLGAPRVLVLDEPTAALGVRQTAEVLNLIEKLRERGHAVVLISHQAGDLQAVADRIVVLRLGRVHGEFSGDTSYEDLLAAMTGAVRPARPGGPARAASGPEPRERRAGGTGAVHR